MVVCALLSSGPMPLSPTVLRRLPEILIFAMREQQRKRKLASALAPYHPRLRGIDQKLPFVLDVQALAQGMNVMLQTDLGEIDLMGQLSGVGGFNNLLSGAQIVRLHQQEIHIASMQ